MPSGMDLDRERSRSTPTARSVREHTDALFNLRAPGNMKVWRSLLMEDKDAYLELSKVYASSADAVPLSFIAQHMLIPGGDDKRSERYVQDYVLGVKAVARYVAGVENIRTTFLETEVKQFLESLPPPESSEGASPSCLSPCSYVVIVRHWQIVVPAILLFLLIFAKTAKYLTSWWSRLDLHWPIAHHCLL